MSRRTAWLRASRFFFIIERASILVGNWSFRNWKVYLRKLLKILERIKFSHFTCNLTPSYWQTPKICEFSQLDWWLHQTWGEGCYITFFYSLTQKCNSDIIQTNTQTMSWEYLKGYHHHQQNIIWMRMTDHGPRTLSIIKLPLSST